MRQSWHRFCSNAAGVLGTGLINFPGVQCDGYSMRSMSAPSRECDGVSPAAPAVPPADRDAAVAQGGAAALPVIAVTCLAFEARIAAGPGVAVLHAPGPQLTAALTAMIRRGCCGIISFGIAGGLRADLAPGDWVVASAVVAGHERFATDMAWSRALLRALPGAVPAPIAGVDAPVSRPADKELLRRATATVAVDMESHIAAAVAAAYGLPFAACRVIIDPAQRQLPPAALVPLRRDGMPDVPAVLRSVVQNPGQLPLLLRVAADARAARAALLAGRRRLGPGLGFPAGRAIQLEAAE
jgi:hopanoid-associated phosphorylase